MNEEIENIQSIPKIFPSDKKHSKKVQKILKMDF